MNPVTCEDCIHFRPDEINPVAGLGWCELRKVSRYPMMPHYCRQRAESDESQSGRDAGLIGNERREETKR